MEIKVSKKGEIIFDDNSLTEKDLFYGQKIIEMMKTEGWKYLQHYIDVTREQLIEYGKQSAYKKDSNEVSGNNFARLDGFDRCSLIAIEHVKRCKEKIDADKDDGGKTNDDEI